MCLAGTVVRALGLAATAVGIGLLPLGFHLRLAACLAPPMAWHGLDPAGRHHLTIDRVPLPECPKGGETKANWNAKEHEQRLRGDTLMRPVSIAYAKGLATPTPRMENEYAEKWNQSIDVSRITIWLLNGGLDMWSGSEADRTLLAKYFQTSRILPGLVGLVAAGASLLLHLVACALPGLVLARSDYCWPQLAIVVFRLLLLSVAAAGVFMAAFSKHWNGSFKTMRIAGDGKTIGLDGPHSFREHGKDFYLVVITWLLAASFLCLALLLVGLEALLIFCCCPEVVDPPPPLTVSTDTQSDTPTTEATQAETPLTRTTEQSGWTNTVRESVAGGRSVAPPTDPDNPGTGSTADSSCIDRVGSMAVPKAMATASGTDSGTASGTEPRTATSSGGTGRGPGPPRTAAPGLAPARRAARRAAAAPPPRRRRKAGGRAGSWWRAGRRRPSPGGVPQLRGHGAGRLPDGQRQGAGRLAQGQEELLSLDGSLPSFPSSSLNPSHLHPPSLAPWHQS